MKRIKVIIEKSADYYDAYALNCKGIYGAGNTPEEAKRNLEEGLALYIGTSSKEDLPKILNGEYCLDYKYDVQSFLNYYGKVFTKPALETMTGINQKLLHHYASGIKKPRAMQVKKIEKAIHNFGKKLCQLKMK